MPPQQLPRNILIIMADQLTPFALGCYGHPLVSSPNIDALARRGVCFDKAYSNSPLCTPARYCFMTGRLVSRYGGHDNAAYLPSTVPTFAHYLRHMGYQTCLSGKMHFVGPDQLHGFEQRLTTDIYPADFGWTPDWRHPHERIDWWYHNMDSVTGAGAAVTTNQLRFDDETGHRALRRIHEFAASDDARPFCMVASFTHPHDPYVARQQWWDHYRDAEIDLPRVAGTDPAMRDAHSRRLRAVCGTDSAVPTEQQVRTARRAYYANVSYVDDWVGRLLQALDDSGLAQDTAVVVLADHGDMLGERGLWYKMSFFEWSARVPLLLHIPGLTPGGKRVAQVTSLADIPPTLIDLAARATGQPVPDAIDPFDGRSLLPLALGDDDTGGDEALGEYLAEGAVAPLLMIRRGRFKYVHCPADPPQLFDLDTDPDELDNLATDPRHREQVTEFEAEVAQRWDVDALHRDVLADQRRRRFVNASLREGVFTPWDYQPLEDAASQYMRNHLDLNDVERRARVPRVP